MHQVNQQLCGAALAHPQWMPSHTYIVRADGDEMTGLGIWRNDLLLVDRSELAVEGEVVVAELNGRALIRRLAVLDGTYVLLSGSDRFPPIKVGDGDELTIWGVVRRRLAGEGIDMLSA
ncbi:S24 family peptidase [Pseudomonas sp. ZM23]|uniref:S24 family peptidase n=1 Tax=Pseudomonas triclosanedens TaxID=2961893 RepID=A0ABY6ZR67_9PSED|nr:S24 family peptidase [Pseudomonas triclosanedens]MCP8466102.1 S24 family peptidase [Pseudomonas triclosanedens]MCP8472337.1 S24 family peptidase [Pseudomonas triclosanedens]MCP8477401.1 S24 family peptidase [Pseudomonas triclosanedens]WAI47264.1 S24 family peptidase [Pseudomonas triclosanedens]